MGKKERELKLLSDKENDLKQLLNEYEAKTVDDKAMRCAIKEIGKSFKSQRGEILKTEKMARKKMKKVRKKEKRMKRKQKKQGKRMKKEQKQWIAKVEHEEETKEDFVDEEFVEINSNKMNDETSTDYSECGCDDENCKEIEGTNDDEFTMIFGEF